MLTSEQGLTPSSGQSAVILLEDSIFQLLERSRLTPDFTSSYSEHLQYASNQIDTNEVKSELAVVYSKLVARGKYRLGSKIGLDDPQVVNYMVRQ